ADSIKARRNGWNRNAEVYQNACIWIGIVGNIWQAAMAIQQRLIRLRKIVLLVFRLLEYLTDTTSSCADSVVPYDFVLVNAIGIGEEAGTANRCDEWRRGRKDHCRERKEFSIDINIG